MTKRAWRKEGKNHNGRGIKNFNMMMQAMSKKQPRTYPLLESLFDRAGVSYSLSKKQQDVLKKMVDETKSKEGTNETV
jgi:hypothetical protein